MFQYSFRKIFSTTLAFAVIIALAGIISCTKNDIGGVPVIERVRVTNPALKDSNISNAVPETFIVIEGRNLANAQQVLFNGFPAYFNPAYNTNTHIFVSIPSSTPTPDRDPRVTNAITVITSGGEVVYSFNIIPPPPSITGIINENSKPGMKMVVNGRYFFSVNEVVLPGDKVVTDITKNAEGTQISFTVPADLGNTPGKLVLRSPYGTDTSDAEVNKMSGVGMISNFDNINNQSWGFTQVTDNSSLFPDNTGKYVRNQLFNLELKAVDAWWEAGRGIVFNSTSVLDDAGKASLSGSANRYALKFEINTKVPWDPNFIFRITFNEKYTYIYEPNLSVPTNIFHTENHWQTVTIPLGQFKEANKVYDQYPLKTNAQSVQTLDQIFNTNGAYSHLYFRTTSKAGAVIPEIHYAIDNVRVVRIAN